ncbi:MAG UNVERIFIED_CONTAM: hypothetical protein LVR18_50970 [Planctomycetaceae bacterium]|jgi:hypothetical protein
MDSAGDRKVCRRKQRTDPAQKERSPDPQLQDFLTALLPQQQQELRQVFDAELRRRRQLLLLSATATASLQVLRSAPVLDEEKVQQATVACRSYSSAPHSRNPSPSKPFASLPQNSNWNT